MLLQLRIRAANTIAINMLVLNERRFNNAVENDPMLIPSDSDSRTIMNFPTTLMFSDYQPNTGNYFHGNSSKSRIHDWYMLRTYHRHSIPHLLHCYLVRLPSTNLYDRATISRESGMWSRILP